MSLLLDVAYLVGGLLASPYVLFRLATSRRWRVGLRQRLGGVPRRDGDNPCVWIHAVSVGEANAVRNLVELLDREHPDWDVRISTTTNTGQRVARNLYGAQRCLIFPLDLSWFVRRTFRRIRPDIVVLVELELWPNFLRVASARNVPIVVVNGRMRERTVRRYRLLRPLFAPIFDTDTGGWFGVQNETYLERFKRTGAVEERVLVTGNMKYDSVPDNVNREHAAEVLSALSLSETDRLWVAGCTWPGEEEICLHIHRRLLDADPDLRLVIAPRHIERADDVERTILREGFACIRRTAGSENAGPKAVRLLDTVGELQCIYAAALFAFIGKSLAVGGGHNVLEPAALGCVPLFGPLMSNFESEAALLLEADAGIRVNDENELEEKVESLLEHEEERVARAGRCRAVLQQKRGAGRRNLELIERVIGSRIGRGAS